MVVVISIDALISKDIDTLKSFSGMEEIFSSSFIARNVRCVYPTLTYPCHATILTGVNPMKHSVIHNEEFAVGEKMRWLGRASDIEVPTILDIAKKHGLKTASVSWPVTGGGDIDYLIGEIWPPVKEQVEKAYALVNSREGNVVFLDNFWPECTFMNKDIDRLSLSCALEILTMYKPDILLLHLAEVDCSRHNKGVATEKHREALEHVAEAVAKIWKALKENGEKDSYLVILGDHGQLDTSTGFSILKVLEDRGLCTFNDNGILGDYRVYAHSTGLSALVYTKDISLNEAYEILDEIKREYPEAINDILSRNEVRDKYGLDGDFSFVIEAGDGVYLEKQPCVPILKKLMPDTFSAASHGHRPEKGPKPPFIVWGPNVIKKEIEEARLVDEAPTILSLLGLGMEDIDGTDLKILEEKNE